MCSTCAHTYSIRTAATAGAVLLLLYVRVVLLAALCTALLLCILRAIRARALCILLALRARVLRVLLALRARALCILLALRPRALCILLVLRARALYICLLYIRARVRLAPDCSPDPCTTTNTL